ncbi:MAG: HAD family hydrolase [Phycisphaerae bacterium]|nr:HAD family hydrolase [Phycisphaerae bacterium]
MVGELSSFRVMTFDCYGTLIDWESGLLGVLRPLFAPSGSSVGDEEILGAFAEGESAAEAEMPTAIYPDVLRFAYRRAAAILGIDADPSGANRLACGVGDWPPFDDTVEALRVLKRRFRLMILSNVDRRSFARTQAGLGIEFDAVVTAEDVGAYKPAIRHFRRAEEIIESWGLKRPQWLHVAQSLYHDHVPAKALGLSTAWIDRRRGRSGWGATKQPSEAVTPDWTFASMRELAKAATKLAED